MAHQNLLMLHVTPHRSLRHSVRRRFLLRHVRHCAEGSTPETGRQRVNNMRQHSSIRGHTMTCGIDISRVGVYGLAGVRGPEVVITAVPPTRSEVSSCDTG